MNRLRRFIINGLLMTAVSLIMRTLSVSFNVYLSNRIGATAMGLFTLISTVYGFSVTLATSGINLATTRMVATALGEDMSTLGSCEQSPVRTRKISHILRRCLGYSLFFGVLSASLLFFLSKPIGLRILRDERTVVPLRSLAITLPAVALSSALNGYFTAMRKIYNNAATQVVGQGIKIYLSIILLTFFGAKDPESACLAVICGGAIPEILSFFMQWLMYVFEKKKKEYSKKSPQSNNGILSEILSTALPIAFSTYVRSALVTIEHILIPQGLEKSGASRDGSLAAYGTVHSMVFPIVLFPSAISSSFAGLLVPEIAESCAANDTRRINGIIHTVMETVLMFAIGCAGIMMCFSFELGEAIYPDATDAGKYIFMIAPLIPVMYLDTSVDSMLKGIGEQVYSMYINIADAAMSIVLVWILLPRFGIMGYVITVYFTELFNATLSITRLMSKTKVTINPFLWVGRPILCIICATALTRFIIDNLTSITSVTAHIIIAVITYILLLMITRGIKISVLKERLVYVLRKK